MIKPVCLGKPVFFVVIYSKMCIMTKSGHKKGNDDAFSFPDSQIEICQT